MVKFKFMIGVLPGYGHENEQLTPEKALEMGRSTAMLYMSDKVAKVGKESVQGTSVKNLNVQLASAVYPENFGCPIGGELGVMVSGECEEHELDSLITRVKGMMGNLGQSTVTVELNENEKSKGSIYISENGKKVTKNEPSKEDVESFSVKFPKEIFEEGIETLGKMLQKAMTLDEAGYIITGILTEGIDKNGIGYYEYSATQNPAYGQTNPIQYKMETLSLIHRIVSSIKQAVLVEFNDAQVAVAPKEYHLERERVIEYSEDKEPSISLKQLKLFIEQQNAILTHPKNGKQILYDEFDR